MGRSPSRAVGEIAKQTKALGGYLNAGTIYDHTSYYTVLPSSAFAEGLEIQVPKTGGWLRKENRLATERLGRMIVTGCRGGKPRSSMATAASNKGAGWSTTIRADAIAERMPGLPSAAASAAIPAPSARLVSRIPPSRIGRFGPARLNIS